MLPERLNKLVTLLSRLPGVGEKTAQRFVLYLVEREELVRRLAEELAVLPAHVRPCERCGFIAEVLVATPPSVDGEATALLLARELAAASVRVSRIASGVPHGGDLEFADQITLGRAIEGRKDLV